MSREYNAVVDRLWNALRDRCPLVQWKVYDHTAVFLGAVGLDNNRFTLFYVRAWIRVEGQTLSSLTTVSREFLEDDFGLVVECTIRDFLQGAMRAIRDWRDSASLPSWFPPAMARYVRDKYPGMDWETIKRTTTFECSSQYANLRDGLPADHRRELWSDV